MPQRQFTGPIISHPRLEGDKKLISTWTEISSFSEVAPKVVFLGPNELKQINVRELKTASRDIRIFDLVISDVSKRVRVTLDYGYISTRPTDKFSWRNLPWFKCVFDGGKRWVTRFILGSCLYPGSPPERELSDKIFLAMRPFIKSEEKDTGYGVDHMLLMGDQIYSDATADLIDPLTQLERFQERYQRAFGGESRLSGLNAHWAMAHLPTYFAVDDHEIENNWPQNVSRTSMMQGTNVEDDFKAARDNARDFLIHHSVTQTTLWYSFVSMDFPCFVFDTQTERSLDDRTKLMENSQMKGFINWLDNVQFSSKPIIIVTGSPLGPILDSEQKFPELTKNSDTLLRYPSYLKRLIKEVTRRKIKKLMWFSGDNHQSSLCEYKIEDVITRQSIDVVHVIASGLYAPLPFANRNWVDYPSNIKIELDGVTISGKQTLITDVNSHFLQVSIVESEVNDNNQWVLSVYSVNADGENSREHHVVI
ncbi:MAG: cholesterol oxidase [Flavobacterium sp.]